MYNASIEEFSELELNDETEKVFLNAFGTVSQDLSDFVHYLKERKEKVK